MNEKQPNKLNMNTVEFLLQNLNGWLLKKTQKQFMLAGEIISTKCPCVIEVRTDSLNDMSAINFIIFKMKHLTLIFGFLLLFSCTENEIVDQTKTVSQFDLYGEVHNDFLSYMLNDFEISSSITTSFDVKKEMINEAYSFLQTTNLNIAEQDLAESVHFVYTEDLDNYINSTNFKDQVTSVYNSSHIHDVDKSILRGLLTGYQNQMSWDSYKEVVDELTITYNNAKFEDGSADGDLSGIFLSIANNSIQWWTDNLEAIPVRLNGQAETRAIPAWFAADIVGAIAGAALNGLYQEYTRGCSREDPCDIGGGALAGALFGSTGVITRIGKWVHKIFAVK